MEESDPKSIAPSSVDEMIEIGANYLLDAEDRFWTSPSSTRLGVDVFVKMAPLATRYKIKDDFVLFLSDVIDWWADRS